MDALIPVLVVEDLVLSVPCPSAQNQIEIVFGVKILIPALIKIQNVGWKMIVLHVIR